jgi:L-2-hydroxyglutarate oxidase
MWFGDFWKLAVRKFTEGMKEMHRRFIKDVFVNSLQQLIPELGTGKLVGDFLMIPRRDALHVCKAPCPAAKASLEIGSAISAQISGQFAATTVATS